MKNCLFFGLVLFLIPGCASNPPIKTQSYAKLNNQVSFENEFPVVWKAIEEALRNHRITHRSPSDVDPLEMKKLTSRSLETDWIYGQSRDKYIQYSMNGVPQKKYLQMRYRYLVEAKSIIGGTNVQVTIEEEVQNLKSDGTPDSYERVSQTDTSRPRELLEKIRLAILSAAP